MSNLIILKNEIASPAVEEQFQSFLTPDMQLVFKREVGFATQAFEKNSYLAGCTVESAKRAIINVALSGLSLNPVLQQAHLVPRKTNGKVECCLDPDYKGLITMMEVLGIAKKPNAHVIYENDTFKYDYAFDEIIEYVPYYAKGIKPEDRGIEFGVLATCVLSDGATKQCLFVPIERIYQIRNTSQAYKSSPDSSLWTGVHKSEMIKKTGIRLLWKGLPKNTANAERFGKVMEIFDESDPKSTTIDVNGQQIQTNESKAESVKSSVQKGLEKIDKKNPPKVAEEVKKDDFEEAQEVVEEETSGGEEDAAEFDVSFIDELNLSNSRQTNAEYMPLYRALKEIGITGAPEIEEAMVATEVTHVDATSFYKNATVEEIKKVVQYIKSK